MNTDDRMLSLDDVYLQDSWILSIDVTPESINILVDFVVVADGPHYTQPKPNEYYCYRRAVMSFSNWQHLYWYRGKSCPGSDVNNEIDYGGFDGFTTVNSHYLLRGDFGDMSFDSGKVSIIVDESAQAIHVQRNK